MINLEILKENPELARNIKLEVSGADLLAFGETILKNAVNDARKNQQTKPEEFLTPQELADKYKVSLVTLWSWDKKGITKPVRIGNAKRYKLSDVEKFIR